MTVVAALGRAAAGPAGEPEIQAACRAIAIGAWVGPSTRQLLWPSVQSGQSVARRLLEIATDQQSCVGKPGSLAHHIGLN